VGVFFFFGFFLQFGEMSPEIKGKKKKKHKILEKFRENLLSVSRNKNN
jgi:inosine/xanthosine triphosphate pyrophosphatase family protein